VAPFWMMFISDLDISMCKEGGQFPG